MTDAKKKGASADISASAPGAWSFDHVAACFDDHLVRSVPQVDEQRAFIARLAHFLATPRGTVYELGCATGRLAEVILDGIGDRPLRYIGLDNAPAMVAQARALLHSESRFQAVEADIQTFAYEQTTLVVSFYTLQFVPSAQRLDLLRRVRQALSPGGALILYEKVVASDPRAQDLLHQLYHDYKLTQGFSSQEVLDKARLLRGVLEARSETWTRDQLTQAGFHGIETIFRNHLFQGWLALKEHA